MASRIAQFVIGALDPELIASFWCEVLGWVVLEREDGVVCIGATDATPPGIDIVPLTEPKAGHNRLHLDLRAEHTSVADELARLLALGARRVDVGQGEVSWTVLADPEGNEFCLLGRTMQEAYG